MNIATWNDGAKRHLEFRKLKILIVEFESIVFRTAEGERKPEMHQRRPHDKFEFIRLSFCLCVAFFSRHFNTALRCYLATLKFPKSHTFARSAFGALVRTMSNRSSNTSRRAIRLFFNSELTFRSVTVSRHTVWSYCVAFRCAAGLTLWLRNYVSVCEHCTCRYNVHVCLLGCVCTPFSIHYLNFN